MVGVRRRRLGASLASLASLALAPLLWNEASAFSPEAPRRGTTRTRRQAEAVARDNDAASALQDAISLRLPSDWRTSHSWPQDASAILHDRGAVALVSPETQPAGLIDESICDEANAAARSRTREMHRRISSRGLDPRGVDEMYRFAEIICRDDGGRRYDVPVAFLGRDECDEVGQIQSKEVGSGRVGTPLASNEAEAIEALHRDMADIVQPVINALWSDSTRYASDVAAAGFLVNEPGSSSQNWHRDGPDEGYVDCFVPLIDLDASLGPTALRPDTHTFAGSVDSASDLAAVAPLLRKGEVLLFDYRTIHRGQGNRSEEGTTRTLAYAVYQRVKRGNMEAGGDIHNFPAALTLEYD